MSKKYLSGFTLIELLITMTIIVMMALVAIPSFNKHQALIELQNKTDEIKADIDEMQIKALNSGQGVTRYYAKLTTGASGKVEYGSFGGTTATVYKTVSLTSGQTLAESSGVSGDYLVCDKGKSFCCITVAKDSSCASAATVDFFSIDNGSKKTTFTIWANPFRVVTATVVN